MQRLALLSIPLFLLSTPALSADLDGRLVERERTIEPLRAGAGLHGAAHLH
jgi:hypothetical protein